MGEYDIQIIIRNMLADKGLYSNVGVLQTTVAEIVTVQEHQRW